MLKSMSFLTVIREICANYKVEYSLMGGDDDKIIVMKHGKNIHIFSLDVAKINNTYAVFVANEFSRMFIECLVKCNEITFETEYFKFIY